ncbi:MAG: HNH endonuclease [Gammaproteobacteria bacterium]|nr:HNH endonuclease [Gammaproteobacteria bacterium]
MRRRPRPWRSARRSDVVRPGSGDTVARRDLGDRGGIHAPPPPAKTPSAQSSRVRSPYNTSKWRRIRLLALDRDGWRCRRCGRASRLHVHHRRLIRHGGAVFDLANLETLCRPCHERAHEDEPLPGQLAGAADATRARNAWKRRLRGM